MEGWAERRHTRPARRFARRRLRGVITAYFSARVLRERSSSGPEPPAANGLRWRLNVPWPASSSLYSGPSGGFSLSTVTRGLRGTAPCMGVGDTLGERRGGGGSLHPVLSEDVSEVARVPRKRPLVPLIPAASPLLQTGDGPPPSRACQLGGWGTT